jgi:hypothetical protein
MAMHEDDEGRAILDGAMVARFVPVTDAEYDEIRRMAHAATPVRLAAAPAA